MQLENLPLWVKEALGSAPEEIETYIYGEDVEVEIPSAYDTFPKLLLRNSKEIGDKTALREKKHGIWQRITWKEYFENVKKFSLGLIALGFREDDKITLVGDNRPEWLYTYLGAEAAKGIPFGVYQDNLAEQLLPLIQNSGSRWIYCEDQEQTDKVLSILDELPEISKIIVKDWTGMWRYRGNPTLISVDEVMKLGEELDKQEPGLFEENLNSQNKNDVACFATSSGTTGVPKCVMLSYENMMFMGLALQKIVSMSIEEDYFSFLPLAWIGEQMMVFSCGLTTGFKVNFYEEPETVNNDLREIGPTIMFGPPRIWRDMLAEVQVKIADAGKLKRKIYNMAMKVGYSCVDREFKGQQIPAHMNFARKLAYYVVFRAILDKLGLKRIRHAFTGGAQVSVDDFRMLRAMGVNMKQIYGQTEISGISCLHRDGDVDPWTSGKPLPRTVIAITKNGEIISKSPAVMLGYYDRSYEDDVVNGWLYSGDMGMVDAKEHLVVVDRLADVITLQDGTLVSPQHLENRLKFSPYIREAMILDNGRPYVTTILNIHFENVAKWAEDNNIPFTGYMDLSQKPEVYDLLENVVREVNKNLQESMKIRKFISLYKEFDPDDEEMTRTRKLRRSLIRERYREVIEALYTDAEEIDFVGEIKYEDGTRDQVRVKMKIRRVE